MGRQEIVQPFRRGQQRSRQLSTEHKWWFTECRNWFACANGPL